MLRALLVPVVVTAVLIAAALALVEGTGAILVSYLLAVLVVGPWVTGFAAACPTRDGASSLRPAALAASLAVCALVVGGLVLLLGLGVLVGAGFATAIGAGAGSNVGPIASVRAGWALVSGHAFAAAITLASWFGALGALVVGDSMPGAIGESPGALAFVAVVAALVVVASNRRWARAVGLALSREPE